MTRWEVDNVFASKGEGEKGGDDREADNVCAPESRGELVCAG